MDLQMVILVTDFEVRVFRKRWMVTCTSRFTLLLFFSLSFFLDSSLPPQTTSGCVSTAKGQSPSLKHQRGFLVYNHRSVTINLVTRVSWTTASRFANRVHDVPQRLRKHPIKERKKKKISEFDSYKSCPQGAVPVVHRISDPRIAPNILFAIF